MTERPKTSQEMGSERGVLIIIFGPMFSGKTGELIDRVDSESHVGQFGIIVKPSNDTRYEVDKVVTHSGRKIDAYRVDKNKPEEIINLIKEQELKGDCIDIIGIDEAQFFKKLALIRTVEKLIDDGKTVVIAGLPTDYRDEPYGAIPELIAKADLTIQRTTARCTYKFEDGNYCKQIATKTQRFTNGEPARYDEEVNVVGGKELYEARCRKHHMVRRD